MYGGVFWTAFWYKNKLNMVVERDSKGHFVMSRLSRQTHSKVSLVWF